LRQLNAFLSVQHSAHYCATRFEENVDLTAFSHQQPMPVIGYLGAGSPAPAASMLAIFRQALAEAGYVEGRNVAIEYRFAEGQYDRLPALAAELVRRQVAVIVAVPTPAALAAKAATATIPIVFTAAEDPVKVGLVANLARPGGNVTGGSILFAELGPKQLGLLRELVPTAARIGLLINPSNVNAEDVTKDLTAAGAAMGVKIEVVQASNILEIDAAFASLVRKRADALVTGTDSFFFNRRLQLATLATRHAIPAVFNAREYVEAGGLMSYGTSLTEAFRQVGIYTGRILQGAKPADLPVVQSSKFEFVINLSTARALGLEIPPTLLARADEVIE
jgi:putative tryptophan/tyrosine transport system substrate-binding protein